jgi:transcriptional regulator with XRE-family HTH domain
MNKQTENANPRQDFGRRLRKLRQDKGWTLAELAERSGLVISTISKAERGIIALTYDRLAMLAQALEVDLAAFFNAEGETFAPGSFAVARKGEFKMQETRNYVYEMLFPDVWNKAMTPMMGSLKARELVDFEEFVRHPGQEFLIVMAGQVTVFVENRDPVVLNQGDSIYFDSAVGHLYASAVRKTRAFSWFARRRDRGGDGSAESSDRLMPEKSRSSRPTTPCRWPACNHCHKKVGRLSGCMTLRRRTPLPRSPAGVSGPRETKGPAVFSVSPAAAVGSSTKVRSAIHQKTMRMIVHCVKRARARGRADDQH